MLYAYAYAYAYAEVQPAGQEEPEEEVECPSHEPASFVKGKPRSILSLPL